MVIGQAKMSWTWVEHLVKEISVLINYYPLFVEKRTSHSLRVVS